MNDAETPHSDARVRESADQREAPSAIINACHSQVKWHLILGLVCLTLFATIPFALYQKAEYERLVTIAKGEPATMIPDCIMGFGAGCGFFAIITALVLFRSSNGLRAFATSRKIGDLHRAMRRLRIVWRVLSIGLTLGVAGLIAWQLFGTPS